ncbi:MAG TPA: 50S ribosomal protein L20 [Caldisericia bacterium]|jgi:large subunit ribosomal protein L20|nr:50S ribosomal protein L20 [Caldisericia bacterium]NLI56050.1 50S ribosomal protein L20 [bacterium]HOC52669.1 50S ribosomal protein L20 [Caldisericia bacterium]HPB33661.1 50S ribosomal protein L20 [Caldisericia bacterium]HQJ56818.1 50S ribosomal protein L20 [Caldisericia bacterium]
MARIKGGPYTRRRRKKTLKLAKGFKGAVSIRYRIAREAVEHSFHYSYVGRRLKKRDMRSLWITRINAALKEFGISYSRFIYGLKNGSILINRKMLSELAINDKESFSYIVNQAKEILTKEV